jgi:1,4-dihydroxy-6-naphthoate synthase
MHPIPLGGIAIQRSQPQAIKQAVNTLVGQSVQWAFANPAQTMPYVRQYAQTMNDEVMKNHINLYVNNYTLNLGEDGQVAVQALMQKAVTNHLIPHLGNDIFV